MTGNPASRAYSIRAAGPADRTTVEELLEVSTLPTAGVPQSLEGFLVAECNDGVIGTVGLERYGDVGLLRSAAVVKAWQGKGVGRSLVEQVLSSARRSELRGIYLLTTTAEGYFPYFGFTRVERKSVPEQVQRSVEFAEACPASAAVLYLEFPDPQEM